MPLTDLTAVRQLRALGADVFEHAEVRKAAAAAEWGAPFQRLATGGNSGEYASGSLRGEPRNQPIHSPVPSMTTVSPQRGRPPLSRISPMMDAMLPPVNASNPHALEEEPDRRAPRWLEK